MFSHIKQQYEVTDSDYIQAWDHLLLGCLQVVKHSTWKNKLNITFIESMTLLQLIKPSFSSIQAKIINLKILIYTRTENSVIQNNLIPFLSKHIHISENV